MFLIDILNKQNECQSENSLNMFNLLKIIEIFYYINPFNIIKLMQMVNNLPVEKKYL